MQKCLSNSKKYLAVCNNMLILYYTKIVLQMIKSIMQIHKGAFKEITFTGSKEEVLKQIENELKKLETNLPEQVYKDRHIKFSISASAHLQITDFEEYD